MDKNLFVAYAVVMHHIYTKQLFRNFSSKTYDVYFHNVFHEIFHPSAPQFLFPVSSRARCGNFFFSAKFHCEIISILRRKMKGRVEVEMREKTDRKKLKKEKEKRKRDCEMMGNFNFYALNNEMQKINVEEDGEGRKKLCQENVERLGKLKLKTKRKRKRIECSTVHRFIDFCCLLIHSMFSRNSCPLFGFCVISNDL